MHAFKIPPNLEFNAAVVSVAHEICQHDVNQMFNMYAIH